MPRPPGFFDKINYVVKYVENPCDAPWTIYFETLLPALGQAIIALLTFGMGDVFRGYFRPKSLRGGRHGRKGKKGKIKKGLIPEVGNALGKKIPGSAAVQALSFNQGVKNLWLIDLGLQRILWWWLVIDITVDFFYHWTSLINQSEFCSRQNANGLAATGAGGSFLGLLDWQAILLPNVLWKRGGVNWNVSDGSMPAGHYQMALGLTVRNGGLNPVHFQIGIFFNAIFDTPIALSEQELLQPGEQKEFVAATEFNGPTTFVIQGRSIGGTISGIEGGFVIMEMNL